MVCIILQEITSYPHIAVRMDIVVFLESNTISMHNAQLFQ